MWEAFLLQMDEFDSLLELKLRQMLDPVVAQEPPARRRGKRPIEAIVAVPAAPPELAPEAIPVVTALPIRY